MTVEEIIALERERARVLDLRRSRLAHLLHNLGVADSLFAGSRIDDLLRAFEEVLA